MSTPRPLASTLRLSMRSYLAALVVVLLVPVLLFAGLLLWQFAQAERGGYERQALEAALRITAGMDRELSATIKALQVLATSPHIANRDFEALYQQASEVKQIVGSDIVLKDTSGQHLVNTRLPRGAALPRSLPESDRKALETKAPYVSDLFTGVTTGVPTVAISLPILRDGEVMALLGTSIAPERLAQVLEAQALPQTWTGAIVDRSGRIIARSRQHQQFLGTMATPDLLEHAVGEAGVWTGFTKEGTSVLAAYARSPLSAWRAAVGVPVSVVETPLRESLYRLAAVGGLALLASALLAGLVGQRMARPMRSLATAAVQVGRGEPVHFPPTGIRELHEIFGALRRAEADLRQRSAERDRAEQALRDNRARLERILDTSPVGIMEINGKGEFTYANRAAEQILRLGAKQLIGQRYDSTGWTITSPDGGAIDPKNLPAARALAGETSNNEELAVVDPTKTDRIVLSVNSAPVLDDSGRVESGLIVFVEITQRHLAEEALRRAQAELKLLNEGLEFQVVERTRELVEANQKLLEEVQQREQVEEQLRQSQKMESIGQLTGGIAHDFNNLLAVIGGNLQMLQRRLERGDSGDISRFIDSAREGVTRAATLTNRLLAFARQQPLSPKSIDVNKLVTGVSDLIRRSIGENIEVETVLSGGIWRTHADPNQLENAILNLVVNARDAMPETGKLTIETANCHLDDRYSADNPGVAPGQYVMIAVTDTGCGIPRQFLEKVFDPFFTTKPTGQGTGLGLSQVYGFTRQSGGHIKIYSEVGQGTTVKLYLPRFTGAEPVADKPVRPVANVGAGRETILVVEDEDAVRQMSVDALSELGYRVLEAGTAAAALRVIDAKPEIKLLFTDIVMPELNGRKLAEEALKRRPDLRILFTTGYTRNAVIHHGIVDANVQIISKPFTIEELAARVREVLDAQEYGGV